MPRIVDRRERRAELARAAWRCVAARGIEGTTVRAVAREAGCSTGSIAHYFESKDALLLAALQHSFRVRGRLEGAGAAGIESIRALLCDVLPVDRERRERWALWLAFWGQARGDARISAELLGRYGAWRALVAGALRSARERGEVDAALDPQAEARALIAFVDGLGRQAALEPRRWSRRALLRAIDAYLARLSPAPEISRARGRRRPRRPARDRARARSRDRSAARSRPGV